ncbi:general transcription factor 3C polypeptide 5 [Asbolus verrucosus]|uniref:General transcription factor 3C polypeptide 5 n=1 Tax=Asbolus verrucosus TaxID=1661398 RepID=A0A482V8K9_ASBVE|nr:general transcription factor 3C polypeptide 5 [Asbolus verrucosus]
METEPASKSSIIRPLTASETAQFLKDYKDIFFKSIDKSKKDSENESLYEKINSLSYVHNKIDPNCIIQINKRLVRIEYPGEVRNINKAIETLGGMDNIELSVADHGRKLELHFHPENKYNRPCLADKDFRPGILLKVKKNSPETQPSCSKDQACDGIKYDYVVEGVSVINFSFNRLCDFQYLPLVAKQPENKLSKTEYIYEKIIPPQLPTLEWLIKEDSKKIEQFLLPVRFSHFDSSQSKLNVESSDKNEPKLKLKGMTSAPSKSNPKQQKNVCRIFGKTKQQTSIFVNFKDKEIPTRPLEGALKLLKNRSLEERIERVKQLFEERPIWTKAAIRYNTGLTDEHSKVILPVVAYYFINGPWRISWVKFGYDPRRDPQARIYQTLDYRIRTGESTQLKVSAKRSYAGKTSLFLGPSHVKKVSLKDDMSTKPRPELDERCYVLRPLTIPPARQMFYQLCDLILPEIQEMISELPRNPGSFCHPKNGWLPNNFIENSRKIVNEHVLEAVQRELLEDKKIMQEKASKKEEKKKEGGSSLDYCNQMLSNIKKGIYKNVDLKPVSFIPKDIDLGRLGDDIELISLSSDEENEFTVGEIIQSSIPEKMDDEEDHDDSDVSQSSEEAEIDMDAVREINQMISQSNVKK